MEPEKSITRRLILKAAAVFCGLKLTGCGENLSPKPQESSDPEQANSPENASPTNHEKQVPADPEFVDGGYRLYGIVPEDEAKFTSEILPQIEPRPIHLIPFDGLLHDHQEDSDSKPAFAWAVWGLKRDADRIAGMTGIKEVLEKQSAHVVEIGSPEMAGGTLSVMFAALARGNQGEGGNPEEDNTSASLSQIVQQLRKAIGEADGVEIKQGPNRPDLAGRLEKIGDIPTEQVIIEFTTPELSGDLLKLIKEHPQTIRLKWEGMFTEFYCPPCGMG